MRRRMVWSIVLAVAGMLALAAPVLAGGWAVVTLDTLPREVRAGELLHLGFMVRQHGVEPNSNVTPILTATRQTTGASGQASQGPARVEAKASREGPKGHFVVDLTLPSDGIWNWEIAPEPYGPTVFAPLTVLPAAPATQAAQPAPAPQAMPAAVAPAASAMPWVSPENLRLAGGVLLVAAMLAAISGLRAGSRKPVAEA